MIVLHASFPIDPNHRNNALDLIDNLVEQSRAEEGTIEYHAATDVTDPNVVRFFEQYETEAAFEAHTQTAHFQAFEEALPELVTDEPTVVRFDVEDMTELEL